MEGIDSSRDFFLVSSYITVLLAEAIFVMVSQTTALTVTVVQGMAVGAPFSATD